MASQSLLRQYRTVAYIVAAAVCLWLLSKAWRVLPGHGAGAQPQALSDGMGAAAGEYRL